MRAPMTSPVMVCGVYRKRVLGSMSSSAGCTSSPLARRDAGSSLLGRRDGCGRGGGSGGSSALPRLESAAMALRLAWASEV